MALGNNRIPSLDGWRAVALGVVLCSHLLHAMPQGLAREWLSLVTETAMTGFFVLSGYLITGLLVREEERTGRMDLGRYFARRVLRIVPPYYAYLAAIAVLGAADWRSLAAGASFTFGYSSWSASPLLGHTWSLSMEEQFYLCWPLLLWAAGRRRATWIAAALIVLAPAIRVAHWEWLPAYRDHIPHLLHSRADSLMFGCLAALLRGHPSFEAGLEKVLRPRLALLAGIFLLQISPLLTMVLRGGYRWLVGLSLEGLAVTFLLLYTIRYPARALGRVLNWAPVVHLGTISYSVYLWQQLFCTGPDGPLLRAFPLNLICALAMGELSWLTVEAWSRRMRARLSSKKIPAAVAAAAS